MPTKTAMRQIESLAASRAVAPAAFTRRQLLLGTAVGTLAMATVRPARPQDDESDLVIVNGWVLRMDDVRPR